MIGYDGTDVSTAILKTMNPTHLGHSKGHVLRNVIMLAETVFVFSALSGFSWWAFEAQNTLVLWIGIVLQGVWFQRVYCVGHEASHQKLFPNYSKTNDLIGQLFLWLLLVPLPIFRKIHRFHHGSNRKDEGTSALDVYIVPKGASWLRRLIPHILWFAGIGLGGWFFHSLISILFFLFLPLKLAQKVSPAFKGWKRQDQLHSILAFALPILAHVVMCRWMGLSLWLTLYGYPFVVFAFVYSAQLYVYHYRTTLGPQTLFHARRLTGSKFISWWLLNLNEHDTHHQRPKVVWHQLPAAGRPLPSDFAHNQNVNTFTQGLFQQLKGPTIVER
ncbi:MAG: fatty acid desaturase family protein [Myxococcota bacterium]